jgi:hypothetical protein
MKVLEGVVRCELAEACLIETLVVDHAARLTQAGVLTVL